ncbi:DUF748 domain-containing protein [Limnobacter parvus]|uniref:DUF748 domain-containing protein n=1 Tax=Limnobacter parvus TaxID=2939690 RepID=A0ABT1XJG6_9BURK|nr:DUF748 domain-containing protein [Limnobacter parvus]MCR2747426.1 DUF748 domain-containing protein [Limnobacter parvus]
MKFAAILRSKALIIPLLVIVLFYLFAWAGLPRLVHWQAEKQVLERSGHVLKMGLPELNPFTLTLSVPNLNLSTPEGEPLVAFDQLYLDISGTDLFKGLIALDQIDLKNLNMNVALLPEGRHNFSALMDAFKNDEPEPEDNTEPPAFLLSQLIISDAVIDFHDRRKPDGLKTRLEPLNLELRDLATRSETDGAFILNAVTGLDAELKLRAQIQLADPSVVGEMSLIGLNIAKLEPLLQPLLPTAPPAGTADLSLNFDVNLAEPMAQPAAEPTANSSEASQLKVLINNVNAEVRDFAIAAKQQGQSASAQFAKLNINNGSFDLQANKAELAGIVLAGLQMSHANKAKALALNAIEVGPITVDLAKQHAEVNSATVKGGQVNVKRNAQGELDLMAAINDWIPTAKPAAEPKAKEADEPAKPWTYAVNTVAVSGINAAIADESMKPTLSIGLNNIAVSTSGVTQNLNKALPLKASLDIQSGGRIAVNGDLTPATAATQLNVEVNELSLKLAQPFISQFAKLDLAAGTVSTKGKATYNAKEQGYAGSLTVASLRLNEAGNKKSFLQFNRLSTPGFTASAKGVNIQRLTLDGLDTALLIAKDKSTNISRILVNEEEPKSSTVPSEKPAATSPAFAVKIDRFNLANSELDFADESLFIPFGTRIHSLEGVVNGLSNKPGARGELVLKGAVDEYGEADAKGSLNLLDPTAFMDIAVKFTNVEMSNLTAYSGTFANRKIEAGKLSLNLNYKIDNQQLNSTNQVIVDKLKLGERVQSPQGRDLPLELAVAILEDSNGRIDLGLPITGNLNDPQFSFGDIVWKTIGNVLTKIVTAPFRALGALFGGSAGEEIGKVAFNPGANTLSPSQRESLKKLGEALTTRPNLALTVQGTWAPADKTAIQNLQMRRAVAQQAGEKLQANEDPGPLAMNGESTQKAIEDLFEKRFGGGELASLKSGFRTANPGELEQGLAGKALGQITSLFKDTRELSAAEINTLKGKNFYAVLTQKLQDAEEVTPAQLQALATQRQDLISKALAATGVSAERLKVDSPKETKATEEKTVPMELGVAVNK